MFFSWNKFAHGLSFDFFFSFDLSVFAYSNLISKVYGNEVLLLISNCHFEILCFHNV